ncbi:BatD family protein [Parahaliea mediterranea]|uniref:BatD family protein n=1 Tax=Parahaliea mediterranea TaxID=651086 RepID=UPI00130056F4|nr:BatD family protein [Parahaliea mediterranea]
MIRTGKRPATWLLWLALLPLLAQPALAALQARVDRQQVAMGDTLRLEITATAGEDLGAIDLTPVQRDFDILQRSSSSSVNIVNGQRSENRQLVLEITPRRQGQLTISPLASANARTLPLQVEVGPQPERPAGDAQVLFEAEVDRSQVYVQGQLLLTLRLQQAVNLDNRSVTELKIDNAFVKPLEQKSFQRTVNGRPWLVHEIRYAIFPEQSGTLEIPAQTFSARESQPRRSLFDRGSGPLLRRSTEPLSIEVLPRPGNWPAGTTWLPARNLRIEETWSVPPEQLQAGESATRTVRISGEGLQGAQLPPTLFPAQAGLRYYPDQPQIAETEGGNGLIGQRVDSAALVPAAPGHYRIPEIRIPWWDTERGELREAVLPARDIAVSAAPGLNQELNQGQGQTAPGTAAPAAPAKDRSAPASMVAAAGEPGELWLWRGLAAFGALGWLLAGWLWWHARRRGARGNNGPHHGATPDTPAGPGESRAYKQLMAACASNQAGAARKALLDWAGSLYPQARGPALATLVERANSPAFASAVSQLEQALFAPGDGNWDGSKLAQSAKALRPQLRRQDGADQPGLSLYPT